MREIDFEETPKEIETRRLSKKEALEFIRAFNARYEIEQSTLKECTIEEKGDIEKGGFLITKDDFTCALKHNPKFRFLKRFDAAYRKVESYFENDLKGTAPSLLKAVERCELRRLYEETHGQSLEIEIESMDTVQEILKKHPILYGCNLDPCAKYFKVRLDTSKTQKELALIHNEFPETISRWKRGIEPITLARLRQTEETRIVREWFKQVRPSTIQRLYASEIIEPQTNVLFKGITKISELKVMEELAQMEIQELDHEMLIEITERQILPILDNTSRVICLDMAECSILDTIQTKSMEKILHTNRIPLEEAINTKTGFQSDDEILRIGYVDERLYFWKVDLDPMNLINAYKDEYFYFIDGNEFANFIAEIKEILDGENTGGLYNTVVHLNKLLSQLSSSEGYKEYIDLKNNRILGEHFHFLMDIAGRDLPSFETRISKIAGANGKGGIKNPIFPTGEDLEIIVSRIAAIIVSDCHLRERGQIKYSESEIERIWQVEKIFTRLGNIKFNPLYNEEDNHYDVYFPSVIGRMFIHLGLTPGDKTLQNPGIGPILREMSWSGACAFMQELIPQDGSVSLGRIDWSHSHALHPGEMSEIYDTLPIITREEVDFIQDKGETSKDSKRLSWGTILEMKNSQDREIAQIATKLETSILNNPNNFVRAEERIAEKLGIEIVTTPDQIRYFTKTSRVSVSWQGRTANSIEAMKLAIMAPPNDVKKRNYLRDWLRSKPERVEEICEYLEENNLEFRKWWVDE